MIGLTIQSQDVQAAPLAYQEKQTTEEKPVVPVYVPQSTTIAIIPVIDTTGEKWQEQRDRQTRCAYDKAVKEFTARGFTLVSSENVTKAITELKIDLTDEEEQKRATFYKIGRATGANLVFFVMVTEARQWEQDRFFTTSRHGSGKIKAWLLDCDKEVPLETLSKITTCQTLSNGFVRFHSEE